MNKLIILIITSLLVFSSCANDENNERQIQVESAEWTQLPEMPTPRSEIDGVIYNGVIYVAGGFYNGSETSGAFEAYHIEEERWEILPDMPQPAHHPAVAAVDGMIYVSGGWYNFGEEQQNLSSFWGFNIENGEWTQKADMPYTRGAHRKVHYDGDIYVISGAGPEPADILRYNIENNSWEILDVKLELVRDHAAITLAGENLYIISGRGAGTEQPRADRFNLDTYEFKRLPDIPTPRGGHTAEYVDRKVYVIGGEVGGDEPYVLTSVEIFDVEQGEWTSWDELPYPVHGHASAQHQGSIFTIGGATGAFFETFETLIGNNYKFTPVSN